MYKTRAAEAPCSPPKELKKNAREEANPSPPPPAHRSIGESLLRAKAQPAPVVVVVLFLFLLLVCSPSGSPTGERREQFADPPPHHPPPAPTAPLVFLQQPGPRVHAARHAGARPRNPRVREERPPSDQPPALRARDRPAAEAARAGVAGVNVLPFERDEAAAVILVILFFIWGGGGGEREKKRGVSFFFFSVSLSRGGK